MIIAKEDSLSVDLVAENLKLGECRELTEEEIQSILDNAVSYVNEAKEYNK